MRTRRATLAIAVIGLILPVHARAQAQRRAARLEVSPAALSLAVGETARITAKVFDESGDAIDVPVQFFAAGPARGRIDVDRATGVVTAYKGGEFVVVALVATAFAMRSEVPVVVAYPPLTSVTVEPERGERFYVGASVRHEALVVDEADDVRDVPLRWSTSAPSVATVDRFGVFTALAPGSVTLTAQAEGVEGSASYQVEADPVRKLTLAASQEAGRTGDVIHFEPRASNGSGQPVEDMPVTFSLISHPEPEFAQADFPAAEVDEKGRFVAYKPGVYSVVASVPGHTARSTVEIGARLVSQEVELTGQGAVRNVPTSDLWVWEGGDGRDYAITGTWGAFGATYFWDVTDPASPILTDSLVVDARTTNDVKVSEDGSVCVFSREGASNRRNGIIIVDCTDPRDVEILSTFDEELTGGVHNVFVYDDHVYAVNNGVRFDVINIEDPTNPHRVGRFELETPGHSIHDVWVVDGIAYTSNWGDGVVVIDVGGGNRGGSPSNPVEMARFRDIGGATHAAFPYVSPTGRFYIFMGDEAGRPGFDGQDPQRVPPAMSGYVHIVDFTDPESPEEVARYEVPEAGSHNLWVEDDKLYAAFYNGGLRVVDVSGELKGNLYLQGREIARYLAYDPDGYVANAPFTWGPQPYKGHLFFAEHHSGLWAVRLLPRTTLLP